MCGLTGFAGFSSFDPETAGATLRRMCDSIAHRGPDADGYLVEPGAGVALGHRRLSIIDLSPTGAQPMESHSGRFAIVFNGEIYGFTALRDRLLAEGAVFRGTSDTEVILAAAETWGVTETLERINGMFALALFDRQRHRLILARDRLGKKPLYVGARTGVLVFGSELKALRSHPAFASVELDQEALGMYFRFGYVPTPLCIYRDVVKLPAGSAVEIDLRAPPPSATEIIERSRVFWQATEIAAAGAAQPFADEATALSEIERRLLDATRSRMVADVPVGAFLSGGIDSTLVVAMMQEVSADPVRSFTVRFDDQKTNEADFAAEAARHIGTDHHEITATPQMALDLVDRMPEVFDEPFADPSQVPTLLVCQLARGQLKVAMSGDGGDEAFGGYARYQRAAYFERLAARVPPVVARIAAGSPDLLSRALSAAARPLVPERFRADATPDRFQKLANILSHGDFRARYDAQFTLWSPGSILRADSRAKSAFVAADLPDGLGKIDTMMLLDTMIYLPDDVLVKVDRASMAVGLEVRAPLLDRDVVEAAWRAPEALRFDGKQGKVALRRILEKRVPPALFERPKQGFGIPVDTWLRGPLRGMAAEMFEGSGAASGLLDAGVLRRRWREHLSGRRNWGAHLWAVLMFEAWHARWMR